MIEIYHVQLVLSTSMLHVLTDAILYNTDYPHECSEQGSSRLLTLVSMQDYLGLLQKSNASMPSKSVRPRISTERSHLSYHCIAIKAIGDCGTEETQGKTTIQWKFWNMGRFL